MYATAVSIAHLQYSNVRLSKGVLPQARGLQQIKKQSRRKMGSNWLSAAVIFKSLRNYLRSERQQFVSILSSGMRRPLELLNFRIWRTHRHAMHHVCSAPLKGSCLHAKREWELQSMARPLQDMLKCGRNVLAICQCPDSAEGIIWSISLLPNRQE